MFTKIGSFLSPRRARLAKFRELQSQGRVAIGRHSYAIPVLKTFANDSTRLVVGNFTSLGPSVTILLGGNHPIDRMTTFPLREKLGLPGAGADGFPSSKGDVRIGNDVWIGFGVTVVSGVTIGDGAIVLAGSVVTGDIAPFTIAGGVPARNIRPRFDADVARALQDMQWWNWDDEKIKANVEILSDLIAEDGLRLLALRGEHT